MQLRPRQEVFVGRCRAALKAKGNTVGIATVGFGKTIALSALAGSYRKSLVIQHREELLTQNSQKFLRVNPGKLVATFAAQHKRWYDHTFYMLHTLARPSDLDRIQPVDCLVIDEGHHAAAKSYIDIFDRCRNLNPKCHVLAVTATPARADKKSLRYMFDNVADFVTLSEMVESGFLVRPRTFVIDTGIETQVASLKHSAGGDYSMDAAAELMDVEPVTDRIIDEWMSVACDRKTIVFATNVAHSKHLAEEFVKRGVAAEHLDGTTPKEERKSILRRLKSGETQVLCNCAVLTEGFDEPSVSCVILARPSMFKSMMVQMIGRGLRTIAEPELYPGIVKDDCIILDFGYSLTMHGGLETDDDIFGQEGPKGQAPTKTCPECDMDIPASCRICPNCGHIFDFELKIKKQLEHFRMTEIDLMRLSPFRWEELWEPVLVANALDAWACVIFVNGFWWSFGGIAGDRRVVLRMKTADRLRALAAGDDWLREKGDKKNAKKSKEWLDLPASDKQILMLEGYAGEVMGMDRYRASCFLTFKFAEHQIKLSVNANSRLQ